MPNPQLAQPQRAPKPRRPQLTQDALIAEALETEERNRESLREFLEREEERKARLRGSGKPRIEGAFIRWKSVGIESRQRLVRLVEDRAALPSNSAPGEGAGPSVLPDVGGDQHPKGVQSNEALVNGSASTPSIPAVTAVPDAPKDGNPVAVHERSAGPGSADQKDGVDSVLTQPRSPEIERHARTLLSVHSLPEDATWVDEFEAIFGTHCHWDALPIVPARNRPLRPRQSTCALTGLPALYKDPRTGIPYANAGAYKTLTELLEDRFVWTGVPPSETGSAPIGYYAIREDDAGAADVFVEPPMPVESTLATGQDPSELPLPDLESGENLGSASTPTTSRSGRRTSGRMKAPVA